MHAHDKRRAEAPMRNPSECTAAEICSCRDVTVGRVACAAVCRCWQWWWWCLLWLHGMRSFCCVDKSQRAPARCR